MLLSFLKQLWLDFKERFRERQGFWGDPGPCGRCGSRTFHVVEDEHLLLVVQCSLCRDRRAA